MSVFQDPSGQWYRGPDHDSAPLRQDPLLLSRGIVRSSSGDYLRVPLTSLQYWQDDEPEPPAPSPVAPPPDPEEGVRFSDYARSIMAGGAQIAEGVGWLARQAGAEDIGRSIEELGSEAVEYWNSGLSDAARDSLSREFVRKNEAGEWEWGDADLNTVGLFGAQSLLGTAAGAGVGAGITKVLQVFANPVGRAALTQAVERGTTALPSAAQGNVIAQAAVKRAAAAAKKLQVIDKVLGATGFGLGEGAIGGMTAGVNVYQSVLSLPAEKLVNNDRYQQILASTDEAMPMLERHQYAAETVAREASSLAGLQAGLTTALLGAPMGAFFGSILGKKALGAMAQTTPRAITTGAVGEAAQEFAQGGVEAVIANRQRRLAGDDEVELFEGALNQAIGGAIAGAPLGGAFGALDKTPAQASQEPARATNPKDGTRTQPRLDPLRTAAMEAAKSGVPQEEILATVQAVKRGEKQVLVAVGELRKRQMGAAQAHATTAQRATKAAVDSAAQEAATSPENDLPEPTPAQVEAGNYKKGRITLHGLDISIENPMGSIRKSHPDAPVQWKRMTRGGHYGYVKGTTDARRAYHANYPKDWKGFGAMTPMAMEDFKQWVKSPAAKRPVAWKSATDVAITTAAIPATEVASNERMPAQIPESKLFSGNPDLPPTKEGAPDFGRPSAPPNVPRNPVASTLTQRGKARVLARMAEENKPILTDVIHDVLSEVGERGAFKIGAKEESALLGKANRPSILAKKPWWNVEHVADSFRGKVIIDDMKDLPALIERLAQEAKKRGVTVEKADFSKFWSARGLENAPGEAGNPVDVWGWRVLPIDLRMPNGQLAEFYVVPKEMNDAQQAVGHAIFEKWRYRDADELFKEGGAALRDYVSDTKRSRDGYDEAMRAYATRTGQTPSDFLASFSAAETVAASVMGAKSFARSSIVPPIGRESQSLDQSPPATRKAANPGDSSTVSPEPSRASSNIEPSENAAATASSSSRAATESSPPTSESLPQEGAEAGLEAEPKPLESRGAAAGGQLADAVRAKLASAIAEVASLVDVTVAQSPSEYGVPDDTDGLFLPGRGIFLFADRLPPGRELEVFTHEVFGHLAMERTPFGREAADMVLSMHDKQHASIEALWNEVSRRWGRLDRETHAKEVIAVMAERGDKHAVMTRLIAGVRRFLRRIGVHRFGVRDYNDAEVRDLIARSARALRVDANQALAGSKKLMALNPASSDADILAALDEAIPPEVVEIDAYLSRGVADAKDAPFVVIPRDADPALRRLVFDPIDGDGWQIAPARYARGQVVLRAGSSDDFRTRAHRLAESVGGRWTTRERGYTLSPAAAERFQRLYESGADAALFSRAAVADPQIQAIIDRVLAKAPEEFTLKDKVRSLWSDLTNTQSLAVKQGLIDSFASIEALERDFTGGALLDASQSAHKAALATKNLPSVMAAVMMVGVPDYASGAYVPVAGRKGVLDIFRPLTEHKDGNLLRQWELFAAANRANRLINEKNPDGTRRENLFTQAEINAALTLEQKYPEFRSVLNDWNVFNKQMLDLAQDAGILDPLSRAVWEKNDYVPFYRALDDFTGPSKKRGVAGQRAQIKTLKGGDEALGNVFENMMLNTAHLLDASFKNRAMQRVVGLGVGTALQPVPFEAEAIKVTDEQIARALEKAGVLVNGLSIVQAMTPQQKAHWSTLFRRVAPTGKDIVSVMIGGKPEYYQVTDPLVLSSITGMGHDNFADIWGLFRGSKKLLTSAVTAHPAFMIANFVRDTLSTWAVAGAPMRHFVDAIKGLKATFANDPALLQIMMAGAGGGGYYDSNPEDIRKLIAKKVPHAASKGITDAVIDSPTRAWEAWRKVGASAENANRVAIFRQVLAAGGTVAEAAYQARDVLNFSMSGSHAAMRWLVQTVPFMNARIQGLYRLYRGARDNTAAFAIRGFMIMAATMALALKNNDEPEYEERKEWEKDLYWWFFVDVGGGKKQPIAIPKPFEVGVLFATLPERLWRTATGRDSQKILWQRIGAMFADTFALDPRPQLIRPIWEQSANRISFLDAPIVGMAEMSLQPEAQFTPWTSQSMRELADAMPDFAPAWLRSPVRLEAALKAYTGSLGALALSGSDAIVRDALGYPESPGSKLHDYPVVSRFFKDPNPRTTKYADMLYDMLDEANAVYSTVNRYRREQRLDEAAELQTANKSKLAARVRLNRIGTQVRNINAQIRRIQIDRTMKAQEKRERIDVLVERKNLLTRQVAAFADLF